MRLLACAIVLCASSARAFQTAEPDLAAQAKAELYAARNDYAATLYQKLVDQDPTRGDAYYGLVRALLKAHKSHDAYTAAAQALEKAPQTSGAQVAAGMAAFRQGELGKAEEHYRAAYKINPKDPGALVGMASLFSMVSKFKAARALMLEAYHLAPNDPTLMLANANSLNGAEHIAMLEKVLAIYDPETDEARGLRAHIANDRAVGDRKLRRLTSPYESSTLKLTRLMSGPHRLRGLGLHVRFNDRATARLLLDTGASGISLSPRLAEKAGLEVLGRESREAKGIGDQHSQDSMEYLASAVQIDDVSFENYPVSVFRAAETSDFDGIIGADVFQRFLIDIDFLKLEVRLEPRPKIELSPSDGLPRTDELEDAATEPAAGFYRAMRYGDHLTIFTSANQRPPKLFLIDSGASLNLIDEDEAREAAPMYRDDRIGVRGIQGKVEKSSVAQHVALAFAGFRYDNRDLVAISFDKISESAGVGISGILGLPVLGQGRLAIDYRNGTVRFDYRKP